MQRANHWQSQQPFHRMMKTLERSLSRTRRQHISLEVSINKITIRAKVRARRTRTIRAPKPNKCKNFTNCHYVRCGHRCVLRGSTRMCDIAAEIAAGGIIHLTVFSKNQKNIIFHEHDKHQVFRDSDYIK